MEKIHGNTHVFVLSCTFLTCKHKNIHVFSPFSLVLTDIGRCNSQIFCVCMVFSLKGIMRYSHASLSSWMDSDEGHRTTPIL